MYATTAGLYVRVLRVRGIGLDSVIQQIVEIINNHRLVIPPPCMSASKESYVPAVKAGKSKRNRGTIKTHELRGHGSWLRIHERGVIGD